jgi:hypothetical protein
MRIAAVTGLVMLWALSPAHNAAKAADDGPWCFRDFGSREYTNCWFYSARPCVTAALIMGGVCERNQRPVEQPQTPKTRHRPRS